MQILVACSGLKIHPEMLLCGFVFRSDQYASITQTYERSLEWIFWKRFNMDSVKTQTFSNPLEGKSRTQTFETIGHVIFYVCVFVLMSLSCGQPVDEYKWPCGCMTFCQFSAETQTFEITLFVCRDVLSDHTKRTSQSQSPLHCRTWSKSSCIIQL